MNSVLPSVGLDGGASPTLDDDSSPQPLEVLVIDGDVSVRAGLRACLEHLGFRVWSAASGWEALETYHSRHERIALVLVDMHLPGLDGPGMLAQLRRISPGVKSCFLDRAGHSNVGAALDGIPVLSKPFDATRLARHLRARAGLAVQS
jgi:CheY-like chemotaxis protein